MREDLSGAGGTIPSRRRHDTLSPATKKPTGASSFLSFLGAKFSGNLIRCFNGSTIMIPRFLNPRFSLISSVSSVVFEQKGLRLVPLACFDDLDFPRKLLIASSTGGELKWKCPRHFCTVLSPEIPWQGSTRSTLLNNLELSLKNHQIDEAWVLFKDFKSLYGFPEQPLMNRLLNELSYSSKSDCLAKAYDMVLLIHKKKPHLLHRDFLAKLALTLARCQMPVPASMVLRISLENDKFIPMDFCGLVFLHMVKTSTGRCLASNLLIDICERSLSSNLDRVTKTTKSLKLTIPSTKIFNLVLNACVGFGDTLKAQQIIEDLMPRTGVIADAESIVIMSLIHERNGLRDELKKLKESVYGVPVSLDHHYQKFYDSLLSLHFKFNDVEAAAGLVLDIYRRGHSFNCSVIKNREFEKLCVVHIGSCNFKMGLKLQIKPEHLESDLVVGAESRSELVRYEDGKLVVTNKALAKLISGYIGDGKMLELSKCLIGLEKEVGSSKLSSNIFDAFVQLGWLEIAHDILDDFELAEILVDPVIYRLLLRAYCKANKFKEAKVLLKQMRKCGLLECLSDETVISSCLVEGNIGNPVRSPFIKPGLAYHLTTESKEGKSLYRSVYEFNSSIYFFCKAKMIEDAQRIFRRMLDLKVQPTVQTFSYLVSGYASLEMYREITILWGEIRRIMEGGDFAVDRDLFECLLLNFIRGGYFERVMEIADFMKKFSLFTDKWRYKREFLKLHKNLYRNLKASEARTEAQSKRLEHVQAFRRWVGIEWKEYR